MDSALRELCQNTCKIYTWVGTDKYGKDTYSSTPIIAKCYIDGESAETMSQTRGTIIASGRLFLADVYPTLNESANLYVQDPSDPSGFRWVELLSIDTLWNEHGEIEAQVLFYGQYKGAAS